MHWSIITLTTVGYGDASPITVLRKSIAAITAIFGVVVVALLTGKKQTHLMLKWIDGK